MLTGLLIATVCYAGAAQPGHSYAMSSSRWVNNGTRPETVKIIDSDPWVELGETSFTLNPGQAVNIPVTLVIPDGKLRTGDYQAWITATSGARQRVVFGIRRRAPCAGPAGPALPAGHPPPGGLFAMIVAAVLSMAAVIVRRLFTSPERTWGRDMKK